MSGSVYGTSTAKRRPPRSRRTKAEIEELRDAVLRWVRAMQPCSVRHAFYLVANNDALVPKTEAGYRAVQRQVLALRREGRMPYRWITDSTRLVRKRPSYRSMGEALRRWAVNYRRDLWATAETTCEVWVEKDTLSGTLLPVTDAYDVPLCIGRGYGSETFLWQLAQDVEEDGRPCFVYLVGDHDASGVDISRDVQERLGRLAPNADIRFERLAITREQIETLQLPTRPAKPKDSRAKAFDGPWVDVEAMAPETLRAVVRGAIERHVNRSELSRLGRIEELERESLAEIARGLAS